jgi:hypothetical protein
MTITSQFRPSKPLPRCQDWHPYKSWVDATAREYEDFVDRLFNRDQGGFTRSDVFIEMLLDALERERAARESYRAIGDGDPAHDRTLALKLLAEEKVCTLRSYTGSLSIRTILDEAQAWRTMRRRRKADDAAQARAEFAADPLSPPTAAEIENNKRARRQYLANRNNAVIIDGITYPIDRTPPRRRK